MIGMNNKLYLLFLITIIAIESLNTVSLTNSYSSVAWPTYKYGFRHTGYYNISVTTHNQRYRYLYVDYIVKWRVKANLCIASSPAIGDVNDDHYYEAFYSSCDGYLYAVNTSNGEILWKYPTGGEFANPTLYDVDRDGLPEILTVGSTGSLYCLDGDGSLLWVIDDRMFRGSPSIGLFRNEPEIAMGSSDGYIYIVYLNGTIDTKIMIGDSPVDTVSIADIDYDGLDEIIAVEDRYLHIIDYSGRWATYTVELEDRAISPPTIYDLNGDGVLEAIVSTRNGYVYDVDLLNGSILYSIKLPVEDVASPPSIGDVNGDGEPEIIIGSMEGLYVLDHCFRIIHSYTDLEIYTSSPIIVDIDLDGYNEVVVGLETGDIVVVNASREDSMKEIEWLYTTNGPIMGSIAVADIDGDGLPEFLIGSRDYYMYCFDIVLQGLENTTSTTRPMNTASHTSYKTTTSAGETVTKPMGRTTSYSPTSFSTTSRSPRKILIPTTSREKGLEINIYAVLTALAIALIVVFITYLFTRS